MKNTFALFAVRKVLSTFKPLLNPSTGRKLRGRDSADAIPCMAPLRQLPGARSDNRHLTVATLEESLLSSWRVLILPQALVCAILCMSSAVQQDLKGTSVNVTSKGQHLWLLFMQIFLKGLVYETVSRKCIKSTGSTLDHPLSAAHANVLIWLHWS